MDFFGISGFEWDEKKNQANIEKHDIEFEVAANIFHQLCYFYESSRGGEKRQVAIGTLENIIIAGIYGTL